MAGLTYIGGGRWLIGVPARDLSAEEVAAAQFSEQELIETGLYEKPKASGSKAESGPKENKKVGE